MIIEYHRPETINQALKLLAREVPLSYPLGGGTVLNQPNDEQFAVVDLQALGLDKMTKKGNIMHVGAMVTLQRLLEFTGLPNDVYQAIQYEATFNLRQMGTVAGTLVSASGRSPLATVMLALDASLEVHASEGKPQHISLGEWLALRGENQRGKLITMVSIPANIHLAYEYVARTPADQPIVCTAVAQWASGRTRLALGGWGKAPILAMDGPEANGLEIAGRSAYSQAVDQWASADYRQEMAGILALRCLKRLTE